MSTTSTVNTVSNVDSKRPRSMSVHYASSHGEPYADKTPACPAKRPRTEEPAGVHAAPNPFALKDPVSKAVLADLITRIVRHPLECTRNPDDCLLADLAEDFYELAAEALEREPGFPFDSSVHPSVPLELLCRRSLDNEDDEDDDLTDEEDDDATTDASTSEEEDADSD